MGPRGSARRSGRNEGIRYVGEAAMSIVTEPLFLLAFAVVLGAMLTPVLLLRRPGFTYAVLYDGLFEVSDEKDVEAAPGEASDRRVRVVAVELRNSSGRHIERPHYARPITVGFGGARILDAEVIEEDPPGIGTTLRGSPERDPERVALTPVLLNNGDLVLLEAIVADAGGEIAVDGRMVGIRRMVDRGRRPLGSTVLAVANGVPALVAVSLGSLYLVLVGFVDVALPGPSTLAAVAGGLAGLVAGDAVLLTGTYRRWRRKRAVRRRVLARRVGDGDGAG